MALYRYTYAYADGRQETNILAAGNANAARARATRHAQGRDASLVGDVSVLDPESRPEQGKRPAPKGAHEK